MINCLTTSHPYANHMDSQTHTLATRANIGKRIRQLRMEQQLSQYRFSSMIDMDRTYLIGVEKGRRNPTIDNLIKIANGLDVTLSELFAGVEVEYQPDAYHGSDIYREDADPASQPQQP